MTTQTDPSPLSPLGKPTDYCDQYAPELLFPIPRQIKRSEIGIDAAVLPFVGEDIWNAYELSWLNAKGKPVVAVGRFRVPADSPNLIESKSFKLYLNSFNQTSFAHIEEVTAALARDLSAAAAEAVEGGERTKLIAATKGRASYVGDRSISFPDAGATAIGIIFTRLLQG